MRESIMHVMVATDGSLDANKTAQIASRLAGDDGKVTVLSVVEVPRAMLSDMRRAAVEASATEADTDVAYRRSQAGDGPVVNWVGDDAVVARYVNNMVSSRTSDLVASLEATSVKFDVVGVEGENAARSVLEAVKEQGPDILCIGTHGGGRFEGLLGSLSTKVARMATCSVVLVR
jgi:nucleotide-binding universal stress UspA family protein